MHYIKNSEFDYLATDDGKMIVFDPTTGSAHFLNTIATDIIEIIKNKNSLNEIINIYNEKYKSKSSEPVNNEIYYFVDDMLDKKIIMPEL